LASHSNEFEIVVDQAEDEIAAINKTVAAWYSGARAIASTSGGGFALMTEGVSLAAMTETPIVIHIAQRPAPATGLPTRTAQEDLNLALYAGHGEFPRIIFAPGNLQEAFYLTQKAFNLADKYQIPVFILTDQYFVDSYYNIPKLELSKLSNEYHIFETNEEYLRYKFTESGISPRGIPGYGKGLIRVDSDEHDEEGHITEDMEYIRPKMVEKRLSKRLSLILEDCVEPTLYGANNYEILLLCWGSTFQAIKEALDLLNNAKIALLHYAQIYPISPKSHDYLKRAKLILSFEGNATGQFASLLKLDADIIIPKSNQFLKFTGEPFSVEEIFDFISLKKEVL
jgi:2-oxoglutarate ferredoxin oxidoreductase subunit alpha